MQITGCVVLLWYISNIGSYRNYTRNKVTFIVNVSLYSGDGGGTLIEISCSEKPQAFITENLCAIQYAVKVLGNGLVRIRLRQKYYRPQLQVWVDWILNPWPPDHGQYLSCPCDSCFNCCAIRYLLMVTTTQGNECRSKHRVRYG